MATDTEKKLKIFTVRHGSQYMAQFGLPGVSISGFGRTQSAAKYDLLLRLLETAGSHMHAVLDELGTDLEALHYSYEFTDDGAIITVNNATGQKQEIKWTKKN